METIPIVLDMEIWLKIATGLEYGILVLLFVLSIWSIAIMIDRWRALKGESSSAELSKLRELIASGNRAEVTSWIDAHPGLHASSLKAAIAVGSLPPAGQSSGQSFGQTEKIDRAFRSFVIDQRLRLEKGLPVLATLGANTPFIGLFGTVLGIIRAFAALGVTSESAGGAGSVMSGISQALLATAAGLFVAIPAVIAFNTLSNRLRVMVAQSESLKDLYVAGLERKT